MVNHADEKLVRLNERINKYAKKKQEMLEQAVTMAQLSSTTPYSYQTNVGNYANALLPGFRSKKMSPLGPASALYTNHTDKN